MSSSITARRGPAYEVQIVQCKTAFIKAMELTLSVRFASKAAGISTVTAYKWRDLDREFREGWAEALQMGIGRLENVAVARAEEGSDNLLWKLLQTHDPGLYGSKVQVGGGGRPILVKVATMTAEQLADEVDVLDQEIAELGVRLVEDDDAQ